MKYAPVQAETLPKGPDLSETHVQDHKPTVAQALVNCLKLSIVRVRQTSFACHIHNERHLLIVVGQLNNIACFEVASVEFVG